MPDKTIQNARELRKNQTEAEKLLWSKLRNKQLNGFKFRRQHPFPPYILDFFCEELNLAIECDGGQHTEEKDKKRSNFIESNNIKILRYWNNEIIDNIEGVLEDILNNINTPSPKPPPQGEGSKRICVAKVATAHGIKGLVKLHVYADDIALIKGDLYTDKTDDKTLKITPKNATAKHWLAEIDGVTDRTQAETFRGTELYIEQTLLPEIGEDEFYYSDLIGLPAIDEEGKEIGEIIAVENFGASDLLDIKPKGAQSFYLPVTDDTLLEISENKVTVAIPEGLLE